MCCCLTCGPAHVSVPSSDRSVASAAGIHIGTVEFPTRDCGAARKGSVLDAKSSGNARQTQWSQTHEAAETQDKKGGGLTCSAAAAMA